LKHYGDSYFCESWLDINIENDHPKLYGKRIPVIHACHGGNKEKLTFDLFNDIFREYLRKVTNFDK
jgi:hypothetical protein